MNSTVAKIKERLSVEEVISSYIKLEHVGSSLKARCPFHNEKTPSFFISKDRGTYYCFGCGASGDIFTFVEEFEGLDFKGALKLLAEKAGVPLEVYTPEMKEAESEKERLYRAMEEATKFFEKNLKADRSALEYIKSRGLTEKTVEDFRIGYAIPDWRRLYDELKAKGFSEAEIERAGLAKQPEDKNKAMYDRFRGRVMFPIADSSGRVIAFSGRIFPDDPPKDGQVITQAKYLNSPETPIFSKNAVLYGLDKAKDSIRKNNFSILVEGQMDLVLSHQAGYKNTVATSGTALSDATLSKENVVSNLGLVRRLSSNIVLAFDGDKAGFSASNRAGRIALSLGMDVKVAKMPEGVDPADLIVKSGVEAWREAIKGSKHLIEFLLRKVIESAGGDARKAGREIKEKVLPYIVALSSSIERSHFVKMIGDLSGIPQNALLDDLKNIEQEFKKEYQEIKSDEANFQKLHRKDYIKRKLLGIMLWQKSLQENKKENKADPQEDPPGQSLDPASILKEMSEILKIPPAELQEMTKDNDTDLIFEAEVFYGGGGDVSKDSSELLLNLREESLKEDLENKMRELYKAEQEGKVEISKQILKECQIISSQIEDIKNGRFSAKGGSA